MRMRLDREKRALAAECRMRNAAQTCAACRVPLDEEGVVPVVARQYRYCCQACADSQIAFALVSAMGQAVSAAIHGYIPGSAGSRLWALNAELVTTRHIAESQLLGAHATARHFRAFRDFLSDIETRADLVDCVGDAALAQRHALRCAIDAARRMLQTAAAGRGMSPGRRPRLITPLGRREGPRASRPCRRSDSADSSSERNSDRDGDHDNIPAAMAAKPAPPSSPKTTTALHAAEQEAPEPSPMGPDAAAGTLSLSDMASTASLSSPPSSSSSPSPSPSPSSPPVKPAVRMPSHRKRPRASAGGLPPAKAPKTAKAPTKTARQTARPTRRGSPAETASASASASASSSTADLAGDVAGGATPSSRRAAKRSRGTSRDGAPPAAPRRAASAPRKARGAAAADPSAAAPAVA
ncbi:hypothetical protein CXG81DRAFT_28852 [Caulochytrium protostelioides]|uniref:Uncharacterized protein n=1 Tax=Caulochytrium protostelioides TaxID=1555241 RepID=A0A4P9WXZ7_9FUNG|nr:hypothetical protein CXG81DRAFT_28852 [Caulochytrium protostelioides]|eukprot:RKO98304.1 hypothetical protein CXG81DRAFT_28852 [Caulochytrium protostelioides]